jgi:hypothetical protein
VITSTSSRLHRPARSKTNGSLVRLLVPTLPFPTLKAEKDAFSAKPRCDGHMRRHRLQRIDLQSHNPTSKGRQPTPGDLIGEGARSMFGRPKGDRDPTRNKKCPDSKPRYTRILQIPVERQAMINTHRNFVIRSTTKTYSFDSTPFHRLLP